MTTISNKSSVLTCAEAATSYAQLKQDLFVLAELQQKRNGYFVDFGATNGIDINNTYLLEKEFGWTGIVCEPAQSCWAALNNNRHCHIENKCVWKESGILLNFNETKDVDLSTIDSFTDCDEHAMTRKNGVVYQIETISLNDLLLKYNAPSQIDYLSLDTEGSEFDILESFNFDKYQISVITVEHNYTPARQKIYDLLTKNGYVRKNETQSRWDDWYVRQR